MLILTFDEGGQIFPIIGRCRYESKGNNVLHRVQTTQLQHHEKQEKRAGQAGNEQILPVLP
jgi:hypothetical protein